MYTYTHIYSILYFFIYIINHDLLRYTHSLINKIIINDEHSTQVN